MLNCSTFYHWEWEGGGGNHVLILVFNEPYLQLNFKIKFQVSFENNRRSTIVNVVGFAHPPLPNDAAHPALPNDGHCMSSCHHNHPREIQVPTDQNILRQTHHPATHRHIHVQPVYMMKTISQV